MFKPVLSLTVLLGMIAALVPVFAQSPRSSADSHPDPVISVAEESSKAHSASQPGAESGATSHPSSSDDRATVVRDPLARLLMIKGLLTLTEAQSVSASESSPVQREQLATLLLNKGILSKAEYDTLLKPLPVQPGTQSPLTASNNSHVAVSAGILKTTTPLILPAIAPIRVLQTEPSKREGLIPDVRIGSSIRLKFFGFFKSSAIYDSSDPTGSDFPLPGFLSDSGPTGSPSFHIKARSLRIGANFEWLDPSPKTTITGKLELDFEGNFARASNRNIGSIRSNAPTLRLAYMRIDRKFTETTSGFLLFGQDWTPFGSSTLPNLIETTGHGIGYGTLYDRTPQIKGGALFKVGGKRNWQLLPEFALTLPAFGNMPANVSDQIGIGERQGTDSARPEIMGRFVTQFQLDRSPGVVPAQLIVSFMQSKRKAIVKASDVPTAYKSAFPTGAEVESGRYGYTLEAQLPTRFATLLVKYWNGQDLRRFFAGQLYSEYNDSYGLTNLASAPSIDGSSTVVFGLENGVPSIAAQRPVRAQGGFINLGLPLSSLFGANPEGRNAGWSAYLHYGFDQAVSRDARRFAAPRGKGDMFAVNLQYKLNPFVTFAFEQTYYRTRSANAALDAAGGLPIFRGLPAVSTHNLRSEFATIFTF